MNSGLLVLLLIGIILMTANGAKAKAVKASSTTTGDTKVVYKYLPLDLDAFYRHEAVSKPSKIYYSLFNDEDIKR